MSENIWKIIKERYVEFDEINNDLKCTICNELMIKACYAPCCCRFCSDCIENYLNRNDKFCPGKSKRCQKKMISYANDIVSDYRANIQISEIIVKCPRKNCQFKDELCMIEDHMRTCYKILMKCPYEEIGCEIKEVIEDEMKNHLIESNYYHSKLLIDLNNNSRNESESMKNEIIELRKESNQFKYEINKIKLQSTSEKQKICQLEEKERENVREIEELNQEIVALKNENRSIKIEIQKNVESMNKMRQIMESNYKEYLEGKGDIKIIGKIDKICEENANFVTRLNNLDETCKEIINKNVHNLQIKTLKMETKLENLGIKGEFVWKLENLSQQEMCTFIYSKPFYSWKYGYKMCLSIIVWLDCGIYVDFYLMDGIFDDKLAWPFKCAVTVDVTDQQIGNIYQTKTKKYTDCPDHPGWRKPSTDRNVSIWYYNYQIPINSAAVRNDQIIIKCKVDKEIKSIYN